MNSGFSHEYYIEGSLKGNREQSLGHNEHNVLKSNITVGEKKSNRKSTVQCNVKGR